MPEVNLPWAHGHHPALVLLPRWQSRREALSREAIPSAAQLQPSGLRTPTCVCALLDEAHRALSKAELSPTPLRSRWLKEREAELWVLVPVPAQVTAGRQGGH